MNERAKYTWQAEALDVQCQYFNQFAKDRKFSAGDIWWKLRDDANELRALATQQPEKFYEEYDEKSMRAMQALLAKANARITRLEAENKEARELLKTWMDSNITGSQMDAWSKTRAFFAKGAAP